MKKSTIMELSIIAVLSVILIILIGIIVVKDKNAKSNVITTTIEKEDKKTINIELDKSNVVNDEIINLEEYNKNITIKKSGKFQLKGKFEHSIIVDAKGEDVTLLLDGVDINNKETAAIICLAAQNFYVTTMSNAINNLSDGGNSQYNACIYSQAKTYIDGDGVLNIKGNNTSSVLVKNNNMEINLGRITMEAEEVGISMVGDKAGKLSVNHGTILVNANKKAIESLNKVEFDGGIMLMSGSFENGNSAIGATNGYEINAGTVICTGSQDVVSPSEDSKQNIVVFGLDKKVAKDTIVSLTSETGDEVISFVAPKEFKSLIISTSYINPGTYKLYTGGEHTGTLVYNMYSGGEYKKGNEVKANKKNLFVVENGITIFGNINKK